jgi:GPI mannosyltransferase 3
MANDVLNQAVWLRRCFALYALCTFGSAWVGSNPFHPDEHFQILEFASYKLGTTPSEWMPWEYHARIRPWLMPAVAFALRWFFHDPFTTALMARLLAAMIHLWTLVQVWRVRSVLGIQEAPKLALAALLVSFGPYLGSRFTSEGFSASLSFLGLLYLAEAPKRSKLWSAGLCFAAAFEARYQSALIIAGGCGHWLLAGGWSQNGPDLPASVPQRFRLLFPMLFGVALGLALLTCLNAWGYGAWTFPAWSYVRANIVQGVAAKFSTEPWYAYVFLPVANVCGPAAAFVLLGTFAFWLRHPKHLLTWLTFPSFVLLSCLGHKEERFLFPLALPACAAAATTLVELSAFLQAHDRKAMLRALRLGGTALALLNILSMGFLAVYPLQWREHIPMAEGLYRQTEAGTEVYLENAQSPALPSFRKAWIERRVTQSCTVPHGALLLTSGAPMAGDSVLHSEAPPEFIREVALASVRVLEARFPGRMQMPVWLTLVRVNVSRHPDVNEVCPRVLFRPIATEAPR